MRGLKALPDVSIRVKQYRATETAFVECVLGNPYSRAVNPDIVMRCRGGLRGLGRHRKSLIMPVTKTPGANKSTKLGYKLFSGEPSPTSNCGIA